MPDDKMIEFLAGLSVGEDGRGSVTLTVSGDAVADVTGNIELDISAHDAARELVTAAHFYAKHHPNAAGTTHWDGCWETHGECAQALLRRWWPAIEAARGVDMAPDEWEYIANSLADTWWGAGADAVCRAIAAALKEGSADE